MSRLRFKVGDLARVVRVVNPGGFYLVGRIVEIEQVGPFPADVPFQTSSGNWWICSSDFDYIVAADRNTIASVRDSMLAPIDPPAEPASLTRSTHLEEPATA